MSELLQWWNLIFILPFVGALFYVLMICTGLMAADHDVDLDHDMGIEHAHEFDPGTLAKALQFLGIGRVPMSIILICVCFLWGFSGFAANTLLKPLLPAWLFVWVSIAVAFVATVFFTRFLAGLLARIMPATETYAITEEQLVGKWAEAVTTIDESFGQAHVHDDAGALHTVQCLIRGGESKIQRGSQVVLLYFDKSKGAFYVGTEMPAVSGADLR
jgi:membrane protein implicated in regulation of membrane protease activity